MKFIKNSKGLCFFMGPWQFSKASGHWIMLKQPWSRLPLSRNILVESELDSKATRPSKN